MARDDEPTGRTRTVVWQDPMVGAQAARNMRGIDYLQAIARGDYPPPPIAVLMGFSLVEVAEGRAAFAVEPGEHHYNPIGLVHGGLLATILDSAMGCAVHSSLPAGTAYTTLELHVNLVRPVTRDTGRLVCEAEILHRGGRVATAQGRVRDREGRMYAHGTTTCLLVQTPER